MTCKVSSKAPCSWTGPWRHLQELLTLPPVVSLTIFYYEVNVAIYTFLHMENISRMLDIINILDKINIIDKVITYIVIELFIQKVEILIFILF